jgi:hypothetical protein
MFICGLITINIMSITKKLFVSAFVAAFALVAAPADAAYMHTVTLKQGSTGSQVIALQQTLNMTSCKVAVSGAGAPGYETATFGPKTTAAVKCFQASNGLPGVDGIVGMQTGAKLALVMGGTPTPGPCPAGYVCTPNGGGSSTGGLSGGAGDLNITTTSTDVEDEVGEGEEDVIIFGIEAEADGSDIAITNVKVSFQNNNYASSSENFGKYVEEVTVWLGDTQVGSVDADDFSKDTGTPDEFSATIALSGAVVREDDEEKLYVAVTGVDTIETADQDASWDIQLESLRFTDGTGAALSGDVDDVDTYAENDAFTFEDSSENDSIELKSSSESPEDATVKVDEDTSTDDVLALVARLDNDDDSSDATLFDVPVQIKIDNYGSDADTAEDVISDVFLTIDGDEYEGDLAGTSTGDDFTVESSSGDLHADGTTPRYAVYNFDIDGDTVVGAGDVVDVEVRVTLNDQDGNYAENTIITAKIGNDEIDAENEEEEDMAVDGSDRTGAVLTLNTSTATVTVEATEETGSSTDSDDAYEYGTYTFTIKIEAEGDDITFDADDDIAYTILGGSDTSATSINFYKLSGDATDNGSNSFTVLEGDDATFSFSVVHDPDSAGSYRVRLDTVAGQDMADDEYTSPLTLSAS